MIQHFSLYGYIQVEKTSSTIHSPRHIRQIHLPLKPTSPSLVMWPA